MLCLCCIIPFVSIGGVHILYLVMLWSWGQLSPQEMQHMMSLHKTDVAAGANLDHSLLNVLAGLGSNAANPQNCHRNLLERIPATYLPQKSMFTVPTDHSVFGAHEGSIGMFDPHEVFASLYHNYRESFFKHVVGAPGAVRSFWESVRGRACIMFNTLSLICKCLW